MESVVVQREIRGGQIAVYAHIRADRTGVALHVRGFDEQERDQAERYAEMLARQYSDGRIEVEGIAS